MLNRNHTHHNRRFRYSEAHFIGRRVEAVDGKERAVRINDDECSNDDDVLEAFLPRRSRPQNGSTKAA